MPTTILTFGAPGSGQTTLGKALADHFSLPHLDLDDYHWRWDTPIPYTTMRSAEDRTEHLLAEISKHQHFVMSGSMWSIRKHFESFFGLAIYITAPDEIRAERVRRRERSRWGDRILPGGDMYEANEAYSKSYLERAMEYYQGEPSMFEQHNRWMAELPCPVLRIDGVTDLPESVRRITAYILKQSPI